MSESKTSPAAHLPPAPAPAGSVSATESAHTTYRRLRIAGLSAREAGSLTAHISGIPMVPGGWSIQDVERMLFVRELVRTGRLGS